MSDSVRRSTSPVRPLEGCPPGDLRDATIVDDVVEDTHPISADIRLMGPAQQRAYLLRHPQRIGQVTQIAPPANPGDFARLVVRDGPTGVEVSSLNALRVSASFNIEPPQQISNPAYKASNNSSFFFNFLHVVNQDNKYFPHSIFPPLSHIYPIYFILFVVFFPSYFILFILVIIAIHFQGDDQPILVPDRFCLLSAEQ